LVGVISALNSQGRFQADPIADAQSARSSAETPDEKAGIAGAARIPNTTTERWFL
jgi:hypothetical protein